MDIPNLSPTKLPSSVHTFEVQEDALFQSLVEAEALIEVFLASEITQHEPITIHSYFCALSTLIAQAKKCSETLLTSAQ